MCLAIILLARARGRLKLPATSVGLLSSPAAPKITEPVLSSPERTLSTARQWLLSLALLWAAGEAQLRWRGDMSWAQKQRTEQYTEDEADAVQQGLEQHESTTQSSANAARVRALDTTNAGDCRPVTTGHGTAYESFCDLNRASRVCKPAGSPR